MMTNEELFASIYTHDTIYLPPSEQDCAALEVALGCSHAKCRFCDFAKDPFQIHSMEQIRRNMQILGRFRPDAYRLFLLGENAFVLDYQKLCQIFDMTDQYMPNIHEFSMYSRIDDIARKTDEELRILQKMGLSKAGGCGNRILCHHYSWTWRAPFFRPPCPCHRPAAKPAAPGGYLVSEAETLAGHPAL